MRPRPPLVCPPSLCVALLVSLLAATASAQDAGVAAPEAPVQAEPGDGAASDGAANDGAVSDGAVSDGAVSDGAAGDGAASDGAASDGAAPLPAPTLEDPEPVASPEPLPEPVEEAPEPDGEVLFRLSGDDAPPPPRDVAFEVPGDQRTSTESATVPTSAPPETPVPPFAIAAGVGWARIDGAVPVDMVRIEQRFDARVPDFESLRLGVGVAEMFGQELLVEAGVRAGLGTYFCSDSWVHCEIAATLQLGVAAGDALGVEFDLHGELELRFLLEHILELTAVGGYSLIGPRSLFHATGVVGIVF